MEKTEAVPNLRPKRRFTSALKSFLVDIVLLAVFMAEQNMSFTGAAIHEWLGIAAAVVIVIHLLLHWRWIVAATKRLFGRLPAMQRVRYAVDVLLFIDLVVVTVTGLWISEVAMRQIGVQFAQNSMWRWLHESSADWAIWLLGLHLALNWSWVVCMLKRYVWQPLTGALKRPALEPEV